MNEIKRKSLFLIKLGVALVAGSYLLLIPACVFVALSIGPKTALWGKLAIGTYAFSWALFIMGFIVAGPDAARTGRRWIVRLFAKKNKGIEKTEPPLAPDDKTV